MTEQDPNGPPHERTTPISSLHELKQRLAKAQPVVVDQDGQLHTPDDPLVVDKPNQSKTTLRPQRWFAHAG
jgi:hypothetical protein